MEVRIENWSLQREILDGYRAPEDGFYCLVGDVYDHPKKKDGSHVATSRLIELSVSNRKAITQNTTYVLGKPDATWALWLKDKGFLEVPQSFNF